MMIANNLNDLINTRIVKLLHEISDLEPDKFHNVKKNRGAFPQKVIKDTPDARVKLTPYTSNDIFAVYLISDTDPGISVVERLDNVVYGNYAFQVELLFYGVNSPYYAQNFVLNSIASQIRLWMQYAELSWSTLPGSIETKDALINNEWWVIRKLTLKLNVGLIMEFTKGELIETIEHSIVELGGFEL